MSAVTSASRVDSTQPNPSKRVNYTLGMVLGVDDFVQEFAFLNGRDQWLARDAIGYGTLSGLRVSIDSDARGPRLTVSPGTALSPRGELIRVCAAQCAYLADWLGERRRDLDALLGSPPDDGVLASVVLCYRSCPVDPVPIPGEPCRAEQDMLAPSRLVDDFRLELRLHDTGAAAPAQREEDALRRFVHWLAAIPVVGSGPGSTLEELLEALRAAVDAPGSPPEPDDFFPEPPPAGLVITAADACEFLRAAFRVWVTELRPARALERVRAKWLRRSTSVGRASGSVPSADGGLHPAPERRADRRVDARCRTRGGTARGASSVRASPAAAPGMAAVPQPRAGRWFRWRRRTGGSRRTNRASWSDRLDRSNRSAGWHRGERCDRAGRR